MKVKRMVNGKEETISGKCLVLRDQGEWLGVLRVINESVFDILRCHREGDKLMVVEGFRVGEAVPYFLS